MEFSYNNQMKNFLFSIILVNYLIGNYLMNKHNIIRISLVLNITDIIYIVLYITEYKKKQC